jgi:membrane protease YdiL (CAAX protease family)
MVAERIRNWFYGLTKVETLMALTIVTVLSLLLFRLPQVTHFRGIYFNDIFQYVLVLLLGLACVLVLKPPTIAYFGWPKVRFLSIAITLLCAHMVYLEIKYGYMIQQPLRVRIAGVISLLMIGFGEEMLSRILVFGTLQRFGTKFAVIASSAMFGLMHINVYLPGWSWWDVYWHVMVTFGFGIFFCAVLLVTRSYWIVAIFHGLVDWKVVFDYAGPESNDYSPGIFEGLRWGFEDFLGYALLGLIFLWMLRGRWPKWSIRLARRWGLVEQAKASAR